MFPLLQLWLLFSGKSWFFCSCCNVSKLYLLCFRCCRTHTHMSSRVKGLPLQCNQGTCSFAMFRCRRKWPWRWFVKWGLTCLNLVSRYARRCAASKTEWRRPPHWLDWMLGVILRHFIHFVYACPTLALAALPVIYSAGRMVNLLSAPPHICRPFCQVQCYRYLGSRPMWRNLTRRWMFSGPSQLFETDPTWVIPKSCRFRVIESITLTLIPCFAMFCQIFQLVASCSQNEAWVPWAAIVSQNWRRPLLPPGDPV